jgi:site-specific DNA-methyltransferase (adenine-specific)
MTLECLGDNVFSLRRLVYIAPMTKPYYQDDLVTLYQGDVREILPSLSLPDLSCVLADPPYGETSLTWDRWVPGWPSFVFDHLRDGISLWCFGSTRMFMRHATEFAFWRLAQDVVWEKHNGSNSAADRFRRVHEMALHWYRGEWSQVYAAPVYTPDATKRTVRRKKRPPQWGEIGEHTYTSEDGGPRMMRSVIYARSEHGRAENETQKPIAIVRPLVEHSCPVGGLLLSLFSGSGTDLVTAKQLGRRAVGIELREGQCEIAARRLSQNVLDFGGVA